MGEETSQLKPSFIATKRKRDEEKEAERSEGDLRPPARLSPISLRSRCSPPTIMESPAASCSDGAPAVDSSPATVAQRKEREGLLAQVDPFLLEVLENSRHRLTGSVLS